MPGTRTVSPSAWKAGNPRCWGRARPGRPQRTRRSPVHRRQREGSRGHVRGRVARLPSAARARPPRHGERRRQSRGRPGVGGAAAGGHPADRRDRRRPIAGARRGGPRTLAARDALAETYWLQGDVDGAVQLSARSPLSACGCWDPRTRTRSPPGWEWHAPRPPQATSRRPPPCSARPCRTPIRSPRAPASDCHRRVRRGHLHDPARGVAPLPLRLPRAPETRRTEATACRALLPI